MHGDVSDSKRAFQTAAWVWLIYLVCLVIIDSFIYANRPTGALLSYHLMNALPALLFVALSRTNWLETWPRIVAPAMIGLITVAPVVINPLFGLRLPPAPLSNVEGMVLRQLPILFVGLVLVAWRYSLTTMVMFSLGANVVELAAVYGSGFFLNIRISDYYFIVLIRTVCFLVVGIFINQLITQVREQHESLQAANSQLKRYAGTLESLTISRERIRMSRELHDTVVHTLSGLAVQLETTKAYLDIGPETAGRLLDQALVTTRTGLQETRRALKALRASPLDDLGLVMALRQLIDNAASRCPLQLEVALPDEEDIPSPEIKQCIYRIAQEALENVIHHANARRLTMHLTVDQRAAIDLLIQDDGIGFNPAAALPTGHFGLKGMHERAQLAGGTLTIHSKSGSGTTIHLEIQGDTA